MKPYYESPEGQIYHGHVLPVLKAMPDESVQMCVTSPPYWRLRDYGNEPQIWDSEPPEICEGGRDHVWEGNIRTGPGKQDLGNGEFNGQGVSGHQYFKSDFCQQCGAWKGSLGLEPTPELFIKHMVQICAEVKRVMRSDGTLWLNMGDSYAGSWGDSGHRPDRTGTRGEQREKSTDWFERKGHPNSNPVTSKKLEGLKPKDLIGIPWRLALALQADGWWLRSDIIWHKPNPMPESCKDRPTKSHEYMFLLTKSAQYFYDADAIRERHLPESIARMERPWDGERQRGYPGSPQTKDIKQACHVNGRNKRSVWTIPTQPMPEAHFATFPKKLIEPCILAGTSEKGCCVECGSPWERTTEKEYKVHENWFGDKQGARNSRGTQGNSYKEPISSKTTGWQPTCKCPLQMVDEYHHRNPVAPCTVLDPFFGSGTSAIVSHKHGRKFIGIELSKVYLDDIAIPRIKKETKQLKLF